MALMDVVAPDPTWPAQFEALASSLALALGDLALRIDHIGSTSVPGLVAKDVIDVQVTVSALGPDLPAAMAAAGFRYLAHVNADLLTGCEDAEALAKQFFREVPGTRRANIHVRVEGRRNQRYALLFRDYLRADPLTRAAYGEVKQVLSRAYPDDSQGYYAVKDPVMDMIYQGAEHWAASTGWPG